ncbi:RskA family anti-sigma factor [Nocardia sp. NPDC003482]|uniref:RskA family anti-sigma factor n=1 Tax=Nocardia sp. NPDC004068 TaxID=3364303 RepID=UPI003675566D
MNESQIDLAHTVALGSIGDEDQRAVRELLDSSDPALRAAFTEEVQQTRDALAEFASAAATAPPASLRDRLLAAIAEDLPANRSPHPCGSNHRGNSATNH